MRINAKRGTRTHDRARIDDSIVIALGINTKNARDRARIGEAVGIAEAIDAKMARDRARIGDSAVALYTDANAVSACHRSRVVYSDTINDRINAIGCRNINCSP